ncbi:MAG: nucleotidyltransferase family protein [Pseudomonadota bacterium]|nr:nucleotidyltransferase family protein [Pseudomonadota bacterium]
MANLHQIGTPAATPLAEGLSLWRRIADPANPRPSGEAVAAFGRLVSAATAEAVLGPGPDLPPAMVGQTRLLNRFRHGTGRHWLGALRDAGIPAVALKGLATGAWLYPRAEDRAVSDADILVRRGDLGAALDLFRGAGFAFEALPTRSRWGFIGDASFQPLMAPDGGTNIDLHVEGDAWPFARALTVDEIFAEATTCGEISAPSPTHCLLLAASHTARDLFTVDSIKTVVDGLLMLRRPEEFNWRELAARARRGQMLRPVSSYLALLGRLGAGVEPAAKAGMPVARIGGAAFEAVVKAHLQLFPETTAPGALARLVREWRLAAEPGVALRRDLKRLTGLVRPDRGLPPGT